jgi:phosphopantetheinyl transferase
VPTTPLSRRAESYAARQFLKDQLAVELGCPESVIRVVQEPNEKPRLSNDELEFSLSHRNGWCAVAVSHDCPVGVDLEPIRPFAGIEKVVADYFPPVAQHAFAEATVEDRNGVFFRWWTRIEAAVKAHGRGLDDAASCFDGVWLRSYEKLCGIALSVAALTKESCTFDWHLRLDDEVPGIILLSESPSCSDVSDHDTV